MKKALEILKEIHNKDIWVMQQLKLEHIQVYEAIAELEEAMKPKTCEWEYNEFDEAWDGKCGVKWLLIDGTPTENHMKFCPQCGGKLIENDLRG